MESKLSIMCSNRGVKMTSKLLGHGKSDQLGNGKDWPHSAWKVTLRYQGRRYTLDYRMGTAHTSEPDVADVVYCVCSDARSGDYSFEEFCSELGYDSDSRKAEATWKACRRAGVNARRLFGKDFAAFADAEH
jgi:hypothetical protein